MTSFWKHTNCTLVLLPQPIWYILKPLQFATSDAWVWFKGNIHRVEPCALFQRVRDLAPYPPLKWGGWPLNTVMLATRYWPGQCKVKVKVTSHFLCLGRLKSDMCHSVYLRTLLPTSCNYGGLWKITSKNWDEISHLCPGDHIVKDYHISLIAKMHFDWKGSILLLYIIDSYM